ncbi:hypothetical protein ACHAWT_000014, partial [Skeletonema menzelii]
MQTYPKAKERWGAPWRYEHFTCGYESSTPVEGSFSAFQRSIGPNPVSFVGVVQSHVRKDREKLQEERVFTNRDNIARTDPRTIAQRTDAENECAKKFSTKTTEYLEVTNRNSQNYTSKPVTVNEAQLAQGATEAHEVSRRVVPDANNPPRPRPRIVLKINGVFFCSCKKDINWGMPCDHVQCVLQGAFVEEQFINQWRKRDDVVEDSAVRQAPDLHLHSTHGHDDNDVTNLPTSSPASDGEAGGVEFGQLENESSSDGVGVFVTDYAPANTATSTGALPNKRRRRKLDHAQKYNMVLEEGKQIANIVSSDKEDYFYKTLALL